VVLITHGTLAHNRMELIAGLQDLLQKGGINSLANNLSLGVNDRHGSYDCAVPHKHQQGDAVGEIATWVSWLTAQGAGPVTVLGHSRGGSQTARYAATLGKEDVSKVVLIAPATWSKDRAATSYRRAHGAELSKVLAEAKNLVAKGNGDTMMHDTGMLYCPKASVTARSIVSYYGDGPDWDTPALLPKISQPVLIIAGSEDTVVPDIGRRAADLADGDRVRVAIVDGAGHFFRDLYLEDAADIILDFLQ
jgi:pimeloyl-ACP methyl ester carboxylesterase